MNALHDETTQEAIPQNGSHQECPWDGLFWYRGGTGCAIVTFLYPRVIANGIQNPIDPLDIDIAWRIVQSIAELRDCTRRVGELFLSFLPDATSAEGWKLSQEVRRRIAVVIPVDGAVSVATGFSPLRSIDTNSSAAVCRAIGTAWSYRIEAGEVPFDPHRS